MFISDCFAYTDIAAELRQHKETFVVTLKAKNDTNINLTLNYLQIKVLADGLRAIVNQAPLKEFVETNSGNLLGDIKVKWDIVQANEVQHKEGEEELCQQNILSAQMEEASLSKTA
ncbi:hypothetical protein SPSIL_057990 [Sporomusa silvacetica DSM 10669]|uniref:Uncharacterized protein n=1 Tax=Sporomusa silvacetica DSM 10669 TaxID=1123289 RepID=A0ABZ3IV12_9FIRM|nr:hypothetical protein [Sporomusa silvacetica]OZC14253.1 hypothetical protein SPSIL_49800 [Sporomusa silvacetica DSM 10669]